MASSEQKKQQIVSERDEGKKSDATRRSTSIDGAPAAPKGKQSRTAAKSGKNRTAPAAAK